MTRHTYTAIVEKEGDGYVALCPELDVASQGATVEEATANLREAVELFLECADPEEIARRVHTDIFVTRFEATVGLGSESSRGETSARSSRPPASSRSGSAAATS